MLKRTATLCVVLLAVFSHPADAQLRRPPTDSKKSESGTKPADISEDDAGLHSCKKAQGTFRINLKPETELKDLVTWAFSFTCKNFIYDSKIATRASKVTLMTPDEMSAKQAWRVFLVSLRSMGLTVVPKGNILELVDHGQAKTAPLPLFVRGRPGEIDQMVRVVLRPEHLPVDDLVKVLGDLKSKNGSVNAIPKAGAVLVSDFGTHVQKMASLMISVDQPLVNERLYLVRVMNADATELATKLQEILGESGSSSSSSSSSSTSSRRRSRRSSRSTARSSSAKSDSGQESAVPSKIIADERTNSLILLGGQSAYKRVKALVRRLDVPIGPEGEGRIHVLRLEHADAEELAQTLNQLIQGIQSPSSSSRTGRTSSSRRPSTRSAAAAVGSAAFEGQVRITFDNPTNSLVVIASIGDFRSVKEVVRKLDTSRPQVYIEASIVEIRLSNSLDLGSSFHAGAPVNVPGETDDGIAIGGFLPGGGPSSLNPATLAGGSGLVGGIIGPLLTEIRNILPGQSIPSFGVLFQAVATSNNANVLSTPHILTTDNKEAEIVVGQNIPYQSSLGLPGLAQAAQGGAAGAAGAAAGLGFLAGQSVQRQDLNLNLKITPAISADDEVRLDIELTIQDVGERNFENLGPVWTNKQIKDTVVVADQQAVVLGGLVSDRVQVEETKIPLLGDIPVLGYLFKRKSKSKVKNSLLVLLTPYIVRESSDLERIVRRRTREQKEFSEAVVGLNSIKYRPDLDYTRKRGLVEEINRDSKLVVEEKEFLLMQEKDELELEDGPIDLDEEK